MVIATSESVSIVRSSSGGLASSAKAIPVSSGRVDDADPSTSSNRLWAYTGENFISPSASKNLSPAYVNNHL